MPRTFAETRGIADPFGSKSPFAEPAWYNSLASPYYDDSHRALRKFLREYIEQHIAPYATQWEEDGAVPAEVRQKFVQTGLVFPDVPAKYRNGVPLPCNIPDGRWDAFHLIIVYAEPAKIPIGVAINLTGSMVHGSPAILRVASEAQKQKWLPGLVSGDLDFRLAASEPTGGSDLANIRTTAKKDASGKFYIVNGEKKWIIGAAFATHLTTLVRTGSSSATGLSLLVIPANAPGISMRRIRNSGWNAADTQWVTFKDVRVPVENLVGKENNGFPILMAQFNTERLVTAVNCNEAARVCLEKSYEYARVRKTFGRPLITHQVIRAKLATLARYVESQWAWIEQMAYHIKVNHGKMDDLSGRLSLLKVHAAQTLDLASREAQQIFGGAGYAREGAGRYVEQISRDVRMMVVGAGGEEIVTDLALRQEEFWVEKRAFKL